MVLPSLAVAGMELMTCDLARGLAERDHQVGITCIVEIGQLAAALRGSGVCVTSVSCPGVRPNFIPDPKLSGYFLELGCDVVHAHSGAWTKAAVAARTARVPAIVSTMHGFAHQEQWFEEPLRWWAACHTDLVVAVSAPLHRHLIDKTHISASKVTIQGNGIDTDRFTRGPRSGALRARFGISSDAPLLGCIARFDPIKNHSLLLAALRRVRSILPETRLAFVGDGPLRQSIEAQVSAMGLSGSVIFAGTCPDTAPLYRDLDVFVLGSLSEGASMSILEALASGVPVVATAVGGTPDLLKDGCGLLIPSGDAAAMAAAITKLLSDSELRTRLAAAGRARAVSEFSRDAMVEGYERLYRSILEKSTRTQASASARL